MARVSFTLRRPDAVTDKGSYLRYDNALGVRTDQDSALRADGFQLSPTTFTTSTFDATSTCYGEVALSWQTTINTTLTGTPTVTGIVLVYSPHGEPQTIGYGDILVESSNTFSYTHTGLTEGRWAYYSLFVHYQSNVGDSYYERVASLAELVPKYYGSTFTMWNRIPLYWRLQDTLLGDLNYDPACFGSGLPDNTPVGPLLKYLAIFGFDMDRTRTLLDYQMLAYDPQLANTEHLNMISDMLGVDLFSGALGSGRLRTLLTDIGTFRRSKGTVAATQFLGESLAGSTFDINQTTGAIKIYSQRVNYITVPKNGAAITTSRDANNSEILTPTTFATSSGHTGTYAVTGTNVYKTTGTGASVGCQCVLIHLSSPIPVELYDNIVFSVQSNVGTNGIKWVRVVNAAGATMGIQTTPLLAGGNRAFEISIASGASTSVFTNGYVEYLVDLSAVPEFDNGNLLAERNFVGTYFDGDTVRGGWLVDSASVSDYRWFGSANSSVSLYAEDYQRMKGVLSKLVFDVLPVDQVAKYTITDYHAVPGF